MENINNLVKAFEGTKQPILIFCEWEKALKFKEEIEANMVNATYGEFKDEIAKTGLNSFSCIKNGLTFCFIDETQVELFAKLVNSDKKYKAK